MDMFRIHDMLENVSEAATTELAKGTEQVNTKEFGAVVDMIKDLSEAEKNKMEACYYKTLIQAMEESEYGEDYNEDGPIWEEESRMGYSRGGGRSGNRRGASGGRGGRGSGSGSGNRSGRRGFPMYDERYDEYMEGRMGYSNGAYGGGSRGQSSSGGSSGGSGSSGSSGYSGSRYGYSHDEYMNNKMMYNSNDPESKAKKAKMVEERMDDLYSMFKEEVQDMSPEEKQIWKTKLNRIINL